MPSLLDGLPAGLREGAGTPKRLSHGVSADSWLIESASGPLVLRRDRPLARRLGLDRAREWSMMSAAHRAGLAPKPIWADSREGVLVRRFVADVPWAEARSPQNPETWRLLGEQLRRVHGLDVAGVSALDLGGSAERYALIVGGSAAREKALRLMENARHLFQGANLCPCHHDPHLGNVVGEGLFIDWEYAALGHPLFDLAVVVVHHALEAGFIDALVSGWRGEEALADPRALPEFVALYRKIADLWAEAVKTGA